MTNFKKFLQLSLAAVALTLGVTSCDKDADLADELAIENQIENQIIFGEDHSMPIPKGLENVAGKTASEFTHIYADTQTLIISNDADNSVAWQGTYTPGDIAGLSASTGYELPIVLPPGTYSANSSSEGDSNAPVLAFLPYTSSVGFTVPPAGPITLAVEHSRGFAIVDASDDAGSYTVTSAAGSYSIAKNN